MWVKASRHSVPNLHGCHSFKSLDLTKHILMIPDRQMPLKNLVPGHARSG